LSKGWVCAKRKNIGPGWCFFQRYLAFCCLYKKLQAELAFKPTQPFFRQIKACCDQLADFFAKPQLSVVSGLFAWF
jgi:hypothetical protein